MDRLDALRFARETDDIEAALANLLAVIRTDPDDEECILTASFMLLQRGRYAEATELLALVAETAIDPATPTMLGQALMAQGKMDPALEVLSRGAARFPAYPKIHEVRGGINFYLHRFKDSLDDRRKVVYLQKQPSVRHYTALVNSLLSSSQGVGVPPTEISYACDKVSALVENAEPGEVFEFAESIFLSKATMDAAVGFVERLIPCPAGRTDATYRWMSAQDYCVEAGASFEIPDHIQSVDDLPVFVAELRNAWVSPDLQWIPIVPSTQKILSGFATLRLRTARENLKTPLLLNNRFAARLRLPVVADIQCAEAISLGGIPQYYHNTIDYFSRLALVLGRPEYDDLPILVNADLAPFQREFFAMAGIPASRLLPVPAGQIAAAGRLVVPSPLTKGGRRMHPVLPAWYRSAFGVANRLSGSARLYISRSEGLARRVCNEREVVSALNERGFRVVDPGKLSVAEQIALFSEAACVVAPTGAALSNMVFMPPGGLVVSLIGGYLSRNPGARWFDTLAAACGHQYAEVAGLSARHSAIRLIDADFEIEIQRLIGTLEANGVGRGQEC